VGRCPADHLSKAAARSSGDELSCALRSTAPSTMESRYSSSVIPLARACVKSPRFDFRLQFQSYRHRFLYFQYSNFRRAPATTPVSDPRVVAKVDRPSE